MSSLGHLHSLLLARLESWCDEYGSRHGFDSCQFDDVRRRSSKILDLLPQMDTLAEDAADAPVAELSREAIQRVMKGFFTPWAEVASWKKEYIPSLDVVEDKLVQIFEQTAREPREPELARFAATLATHHFDALRSVLLRGLNAWLTDQREDGLVDEDRLDEFEAVARGVFDLLTELAVCTDALLLGEVDALDEDEIHRAFEAFAGPWADVECDLDDPLPAPEVLEDKLVEIEQLLRGDETDEGKLEEFVHELRVFLEESGFSL